jgi:hypothetical protein
LYAMNDVCEVASEIVLPNATDCPAESLQFCIDADVAGAVALELRIPEIDIRRRLGIMRWTTVPETSVYENGNARRSETQVRSARKTGTQPIT